MPNTSFTFTIEDRPDYLYGCIEAEEMSLDLMIRYMNDLANHVRDKGYTRLLTVRKTPIMMPVETYAFIGDVARKVFPANFRIALLDQHPEHASLAKTAEAEVRGAGMNVKLFRTFEECERWLLSDEP